MFRELNTSVPSKCQKSIKKRPWILFLNLNLYFFRWKSWISFWIVLFITYTYIFFTWHEHTGVVHDSSCGLNARNDISTNDRGPRRCPDCRFKTRNYNVIVLFRVEFVSNVCFLWDQERFCTFENPKCPLDFNGYRFNVTRTPRVVRRHDGLLLQNITYLPKLRMNRSRYNVKPTHDLVIRLKCGNCDRTKTDDERAFGRLGPGSGKREKRQNCAVIARALVANNHNMRTRGTSIEIRITARNLLDQKQVALCSLLYCMPVYLHYRYCILVQWIEIQ